MKACRFQARVKLAPPYPGDTTSHSNAAVTPDVGVRAYDAAAAGAERADHLHGDAAVADEKHSAGRGELRGERVNAPCVAHARDDAGASRRQVLAHRAGLSARAHAHLVVRELGAV